MVTKLDAAGLSHSFAALPTLLVDIFFNIISGGYLIKLCLKNVGLLVGLYSSKRELAELVEEMKIGSNNFFSKLFIFWCYFKVIYKIFL